jgi:hypothetical protein
MISEDHEAVVIPLEYGVCRLTNLVLLRIAGAHPEVA